jgi:hypothetical protein
MGIGNMQEKAIVYFVVVYLACWFIDLAVIVAYSPVFLIGPTFKLIIVLICLIFVLINLAKARWLTVTGVR